KPPLAGKQIDCPKCKYRFEARRLGNEALPRRGPNPTSRGPSSSLPVRVAVLCYRAARGLALLSVFLVSMALVLCAVMLVVGGCIGAGRAPKEAAVLALLFALAAALAFGFFAVISWAVRRDDQPGEEDDPPVSLSDRLLAALLGAVAGLVVAP